jgi:hypothetical protein
MMRRNLFSRSLSSFQLHWKRLFIELLVVFIGVYGAFWLNSYREEQHQLQVRKNYFISFQAELRDINEIAKQVAAASDTLHQRYNSAIANGERPLLKVHPQLDYSINMFITRSSFNQQHFESIGSDYLANVSRGSNLISFLQKRMDLFQDKSRDLMLFSGGNTSILYDEDGSLKQAYQWYLQDLAFISQLAKNLSTAIEQGAIPQTEQILQDLE